MIPAHWQSKANYFRFLLRQYLSPKKTKNSSVLSISTGEFDNSGLCIVYGKANGLINKTIMVIGAERGGTSMTAGILTRLGVYMGDTISETYEDHEINHCLRTNNKKRAFAVIKQRNQLYSTWGLKRPTLNLLKDSWQNLFREPVYIVIFRDVLAIANRRSISRGLDLFSGVHSSLNTYQQIINFIYAKKRPTLMVSYEKTLLNPELFVRTLADFIGIENEEKITSAITFIEPSPKIYHTASTIHKGWLGTLDNVTAADIYGWAFREGEKKPVNVVLTLADGTQILTCANLLRCDVHQHHKHVSEFCGFQFQLSKAQQLKNGDTIRVRIEGEQHDLINSPFTYNA